MKETGRGSLLLCLLLALASCTTSSQTTTTSTTRSSTTTSTTAATTQPTSTSTTTTSEPEPAFVEVVVESGQVVGGVKSIDVDIGDEVRIRVLSDVDEHVHVHGYDLFFDVVAGMPTDVEFTADIPGVFEVELEDGRLLIAELEVS